MTGKSMIEKIIGAHITEGKPEKGEEIGINVDQILTEDATGVPVFLEFESLGLKEVKRTVVSYIDHNTIQVGFENADDHKYLRTVAEKYGVILSRAGNGICHQVHLERFAKPGTILLGADSHTPTAGGIGAIGIGAGGLDVAVAMSGRPFYMIYPKIINIRLSGKLQPWVSAKDIVLKVLQILTTKGNVNYAIEYTGPGVKSLSVPERATITNMGTETGVTTSIFPSDEITLDFLKKQGREREWIPLEADPDAVYDKIINLDLSEIEPLIACPDSPDNVKTVRELEGIKVDQVAIGSCTNSSYRDLMIIANILGGRSIPKTVSSGLAPGSRQVLSMLIENKTIGNFVKSGIRIMEAACGFCFGGTFAPGSGEVSLRTNNRNYKGRSGTADAKVYLVSPETAAASAIMGEITDPRRLEQLGIKYENVVPTFPERFFIDDSMFIFPLPQDEREKVQVIRGPNIKPIPDNTPLQDNLKGVVTIKVGDKITTDHIMPAGQYLKYWSNIPEYSKHTFEIVDTTFYQRAIENRNNGIGNFIVAGESYGQGSSREHAALCPMYLGVKAVIAKSFERMHRTNLANFGIVPLQFIDPNDYNLINQGDKIDLIGIRKKIEQKQDTISLINRSTGKEIKLAILLTDRERNFILEGGLLPYIRRVERTNNSTSN